MSKGTDHTFTTAVFTVPSDQRFVRLKVKDPNNSSSDIQLRGDARTIFGGYGMWDTWASNVSAIWTDGNGCKIKVHNSGTSNYSMRISVVFETEDLPTYKITCKSQGGGVLTANKYEACEGRWVALTPIADHGYSFSHFITSPNVSINTNNKFQMPAANVTVTAVFVSQDYALNVVSEDTNKGTVTGGGRFPVERFTDISATAKPGYIFTGWTATNGFITNPSAPSTTFVMSTEGVATVTAHFAVKPNTKSVVGLYVDGAFTDCNVSVYHEGQFVDCDVYIYTEGQFRKCSKGGSG